MLAIPVELQSRYEDFLRRKAFPKNEHGAYQKWLRYYLDYCRKYRTPPKYKNSLPLFIQKLVDKQQSKSQQTQAAKAVTLYYDLLDELGIPYKAAAERPGVSFGNASLNNKKPKTLKRTMVSLYDWCRDFFCRTPIKTHTHSDGPQRL